MIPEPTLRRLPWYLSYVSELSADGVDYVSTTQVAYALGIDAAQTSKDMSHIGVSGRPRVGYEVATLRRALLDTLGFSVNHRAAVIGVGSLGAALLGDVGLRQFGMDIVAGFDINPSVVGTAMRDIDIYDLSRLADIRRSLDIRIAIITVPAAAAQHAADAAMDAGIRALWNFTPRRILPRDGVVIQNALIYTNLAILYNQMLANDESPAH